MELCAKCKKMTAERNHYTREVICYNRYCDQESSQLKVTSEKRVSSYGEPDKLVPQQNK